MPSRRRLVTLLTALALATCPSSALAQGAGDDQYEDPFGDEVPQTEATPGPAPSGGSSEPAPVTGETPESEVAGESEAADDQTPAPGAVPAQRTQLPATGSDALLVGMLGVAFVAGGAGLRLRLRDGATTA